MKKKKLVETNPCLRNPAEREAALMRAIISSFAVEDICCAGFDETPLKAEKKTAKKTAVRRSSRSKGSPL